VRAAFEGKNRSVRLKDCVLVKSKGRRRAASLKAGPDMAGRARVAASHAKRRKDPPVSRAKEEIRAKAYALRCIANLVEEGLANIERLADGESELRLATGEVYRLGKNTVRRIV
jgi:hypothetical protein